MDTSSVDESRSLPACGAIDGTDQSVIVAYPHLEESCYFARWKLRS
jgi:hypothetical protein